MTIALAPKMDHNHNEPDFGEESAPAWLQPPFSTSLQNIGTGCAIIFLIFALPVAAFNLLSYFKTRMMVEDVLKERHIGKNIKILDRESFERQYCVSAAIEDGSSAVSMVVGDSDGGSYSWSKDYPTMEDCVRSYSRG